MSLNPRQLSGHFVHFTVIIEVEFGITTLIRTSEARAAQ